MGTRIGLIAAIAILTLVASCAPDSNMSPYDPPQKPVDWDSHKLHCLALGDSYTIGEGVDAKDAFPAQLVNALKGRGEDFAQPLVVAQTGWTTSQLHGAVDAAALKDKFDLVTLLIGVNNQYRGEGLAEYPAQFERLLSES